MVFGEPNFLGLAHSYRKSLPGTTPTKHSKQTPTFIEFASVLLITGSASRSAPNCADTPVDGWMDG